MFVHFNSKAFDIMVWLLVIATNMFVVVDKKERQDHKDPEKELNDSALKPYHRQFVLSTFSLANVISFYLCSAETSIFIVPNIKELLLLA